MSRTLKSITFTIRESLVNRFLALLCAGDVLNAIGPMTLPLIEIAKAMTVVQYLKRIVLRSKAEFTLVEFNAGLGLTGVLAAHLFPMLKKVLCYNHRVPGSPLRFYENVKRFQFKEGSIPLFDKDGVMKPESARFYKEFREQFGESDNVILMCTNADARMIKCLTAIYNSELFIQRLIIVPNEQSTASIELPKEIYLDEEAEQCITGHAFAKGLQGGEFFIPGHKADALPALGMIVASKNKKKKGKVAEKKADA